MLNKIWKFIKSPFVWVDRQVSRILPGFKTYIVLLLGAIGNASDAIREYLSQLPGVEQWVTGGNLLIANAVLFTLAFWFKDMTSRNR